MRVAVYVRVSTEDQVKYGYSLPDQRRSCRERAEQIGATSIVDYADEGTTGAALDRPGLSALREAVRGGQVDVIVALDPDRIHRKLVNQLIVTEEFEKAGARLEFLNFSVDGTPEGKMFYSIRGAVAEYEKEKIRDRTIRGKNQKARMGGIPIGFCTYGYLYTPETGKVTSLRSESLVVRKIFEWWTTEDVGINTIARRLNDEGIPTKRRRPQWHRRTVLQIVTNPVYKGEWHYNDIIIPVPALVSKDTWERAQDKVVHARRLYANRGRQQYLLSGLITCGDCHQTMCGIYANWWGRKERRYFCTKHWEGAAHPGCQPAKMLLAYIVEQIVWDQVCSWLHDPDQLAKESLEGASGSKLEDLRAEAGNIDEELVRIEKGRANVMDALAAGLAELDEVTQASLARAKNQQDKLVRRKAEILKLIEDEEGILGQVEELRTLATELLDRLDELDFPEKRALVRTLVAQVIVKGRPVPGGDGYRGVDVRVIARLVDPSIGGPGG